MSTSFVTVRSSDDRVLRSTGPITRLYAKSLLRYCSEITLYPNLNMLEYAYGGKTHLIFSAYTALNPYPAAAIADHKYRSKPLMQRHDIRVPKAVALHARKDELTPELIHELQFPLVIKSAEHTFGGRDVYTEIETFETLHELYEYLRVRYKTILIEEYVSQKTDFRLLMLNGELIAATQRIPAHVIGDGSSTIQMLIDAKNALRTKHEEKYPIQVSDEGLALLREQGFDLESVIPAEQTVSLNRVCNIVAGGETWDVTDTVHREYIALGRRITELLDVRLVGIDIMAKSISEFDTEYMVIELNPNPGILGHVYPDMGTPRDVHHMIIDALIQTHQ
jgi:cyanophycin synthetase